MIVTARWKPSLNTTVRNCFPLPRLLLIDQADRENVARAARKRAAPSEDAKHSSRRTTQNRNRPDAIFDQRPVELTGPPIAIYHPIFAQFRSLASSDFAMDETILQNTWNFIETSRSFYADEYHRAPAVTQSLHRLVPSFAWKPGFGFEDGRRIGPDGAVSVSLPQCPNLVKTPVCVFFEMKNEVGAGGCDPVQQCQSDFVRLYSSDDVSAFPSWAANLVPTETVEGVPGWIVLSRPSRGDCRSTNRGLWRRICGHFHH